MKTALRVISSVFLALVVVALSLVVCACVVQISLKCEWAQAFICVIPFVAVIIIVAIDIYDRLFGTGGTK